MLNCRVGFAMLRQEVCNSHTRPQPLLKDRHVVWVYLARLGKSISSLSLSVLYPSPEKF